MKKINWYFILMIVFLAYGVMQTIAARNARSELNAVQDKLKLATVGLLKVVARTEDLNQQVTQLQTNADDLSINIDQLKNNPSSDVRTYNEIRQQMLTIKNAVSNLRNRIEN